MVWFVGDWFFACVCLAFVLVLISRVWTRLRLDRKRQVKVACFSTKIWYNRTRWIKMIGQPFNCVLWALKNRASTWKTCGIFQFPVFWKNRINFGAGKPKLRRELKLGVFVTKWGPFCPISADTFWKIHPDIEFNKRGKTNIKLNVDGKTWMDRLSQMICLYWSH